MSVPISRCPFEHIHDPDKEAQQIAETTDLTIKLLDKRYPPPAPILRGVHPKSHGCVKASFTINPDIAPELQVGLFATPGRQFAAYIRFSNAAALVGPDTVETDPVSHLPVEEHGSRGMAIKVLDVGGEVLIDDNGANNQDFLMINQPMFAFANTEDYLRLDRVLLRDNDIAAGFFAPLQLQLNPQLKEEQKRAIQAYIEAENITPDAMSRMADSLKIIKGIIQKTDVGNPLGIQYFSAAPFLFGADRVMKFSAKPCALVPPLQSPPKPRPENYLRTALTETMESSQPLEFDFMVQVRSDADGDDLGIENASSLWDEAKHPFIKVAKIVIPTPQIDVDSETHQAHCEKLAFTPWHSLAAHQPIGSINRLRKSVYQASANHRLAVEPQPMPYLIRMLERFFKAVFG